MPGDARLRVRAHVAGETQARPRLDVELEVTTGITAIMGHSGAGKTTLLETIAGLVAPTQGRIVLDDEVLFDEAAGISIPPHKRRVALVFQSLALFPHLRAWQNVAYALTSLPKTARREQALTWMARTQVDHLADRHPASLSGGEAQRVALARALASSPRALLLDEPFSALDGKLRRQLGADLQALVAEVNIPTLLVTHDREDAMSLGTSVLTLEAGRLVARSLVQGAFLATKGPLGG